MIKTPHVPRSPWFIAITFFLLCTVEVYSQNKEISQADIWKNGSFVPESVSGIRSMQDGEHYTTKEADGKSFSIVKWNYKSGNKVETLVNGNELLDSKGDKVSISDYHFNADESKVLIASEEESIYRHSSKANYYVYDLENKKLSPLTDFSKGKQQLAEFSPDSKKVAFVRSNNLFIKDLGSEKETAVTTDGKWGEIINGAVDWVYEEEFSFHHGFYWSPEGSKIAFYRFDESEVKEFDLTIYDGLYPSEYRFKYPKAGMANSVVDIKVYHLNSNQTTNINVGSENDQYIPRIKWTSNDDLLSIMRLNRLQNHLEFLLADVSEPSASGIDPKVFYEETSKTYLEINDNLIFLKDGNHFLWNSEKSGYNHIYLYTLEGKLVGQLTKGKWEVIDFFGVDETAQKVFFSSNKDSAIDQGIYSVSYSPVLRQHQKNKGTEITTAFDNSNSIENLTPGDGTNNAYFSKGFKYFINFHSDANTPYYISLKDQKGKNIRVIKDNEELKTRLKDYTLAEKKFSRFVTGNGDTLNYWMMKPNDFDSTKAYPLMMIVYGGPGSNTVVNSWGGANYFWHQMLVQKGYIVMSVDPRGTMRRGRDFKHSTYLQLGKLETEDVIETAKHFASKSFIDKERIGIQGWSYGGYMSSLAMTKGAEYFSLGIAVAPVTNWRFYDSIYTERFMRTPEENASGYDNNSPINHVEKLKGDFLLVHGSGDDNVHYQNTMEMIEALVEADKQFELYIYPNKNHGIYGGNTRNHLYTKMTNFITENL